MGIWLKSVRLLSWYERACQADLKPLALAHLTSQPFEDCEKIRDTTISDYWFAWNKEKGSTAICLGPFSAQRLSDGSNLRYS